MNRNTSTTHTASNQPELPNEMPQVLINYLLSLAVQLPGFAPQYFMLEPQMLGGRVLQRITHFAAGCEQQHLVFGFEPITCVLEAWPSGSGFLLCRSRASV